ncbi:hypothetical protein MKX01_006599 [Papaver californicum]|nr:hypothetical protein MKX01_006599 [Papaver californicum]
MLQFCICKLEHVEREHALHQLRKEDSYKELEVAIQKKQQLTSKLPSSLKMVNVKAYEPQVVSIGPYHNGKPHLMPMVIHKKRALVHFVKRSGVPLQTYITELMKVVDELKLLYTQLDQDWIHGDQKFVELMIVDGCFLLEFLAVGTSFHGKTVTMLLPLKICSQWRTSWQLPYLVLTTLLSVARPEEDAHETLSHMMLCHSEGPRRHILDRYAERLYYQFGIRFKKVSGYKNIRLDYKQTVLLFPPVMIHYDHQNPFLNMRAFEVWVSEDLKFHSFIYLNKTLSIQVLTKDIGMFNVDSEPSVALQDMNEMCRIWIPNLYENYFSNPWTIISLVAAAFFMALTMVQTYTYYTIISNKSSN